MRAELRIAPGLAAGTRRSANGPSAIRQVVIAKLRFGLACLLLAACGSEDAGGPDVQPDAQLQAGFGRRCNSDEQCESNACVPSVGDTVCSQACDPDNPCPNNWTCWTPPGATNYVGSFCVSPHWALCRPCTADADCASVSQDEPGACLNYNDSGTFCGSDCTTSADCPEGFSCSEAQTRTGRQVRQCTNNSGMCECNAYISSLGEATRCATENQWGRCQGERVCDSKLWSRCDAEVPAPDAPNQRDDDCDGLTDEVVCLCGDNLCDGNCGETLANCPCDCATEGDGVCSPCGENPGTSPADCCRGPGGTTGCGDGFCMGFGCQENPATCPQDCSTACGNKFCEPGENPFNCAEDCLHSVCGNNVCEATDGGPEVCPQDCDAFCGDCECDPARDESVFNCAIDCGYCGDGSCSPCAVLNESVATCGQDCCVPSAEICNNIDDDCDGQTDEDNALGCRVLYRDEDGDDIGRWDDVRCLCDATSFWTATVLGDCDDDDLAVGLGEPESCNSRDDDCDGETDEGFGLGDPCAAPGGPCYDGVMACDGLEGTQCVDGSARAKGTTCSDLVCFDGVIRPPSLCDGVGECVPLSVVHCNGYMCDDSGRCDSECSTDDDCREGYACGATQVCERFAALCTTDISCIDQDWTTIDFCAVVCGHGPRIGELATGDIDGDTIPNDSDNCPETANRDQLDQDEDGRGDACDRCEGAGSVEICNALDDNCDGQTDEGLGVGVSCVADDNSCRVGVRVCGAATTRCPGVNDAPAGFECAPATCVGDGLRLASRCDGAGACDMGALISCQGFLCQDNAVSGEPSCTGTCVDDDGCAAGHHCAVSPRGGVCAPDLANGQECGGDRQCASGMCVDGVCCSSACGGGCSTCAAPGFLGQCRAVTANTDPKNACGACGMCNAAGACANAAAGTSPKDACPVELPCGTTGLCAAGGQCAIASAGTTCDSASCVAGDLTVGTTCDGVGQCRDATTNACPNDLLCATATTCLARCTTDRDCRVGNYCAANGQCVDLVANGQSCTLDHMCVSGICADGVCCDGRCGGDCQACDLAATRGVCTSHPSDSDPESECGRCATCNGSGACGPSAAGTDPSDECAAVAPCGTDGFCDGNFGCAVTTAGTPCGTSSCVGSVLIAARQCDGQGSCASPVIAPCSAYVCDEAAGACRTTCANNSQCQTGFYCGSGICKPKLPQGSTCGAAIDCASGFCVDEVCCGSTCASLCQTCNGGNPGTCTPLNNETDGACTGHLICTAGECKRKGGVACSGDADCATGNCVDNTCCATACDGDCRTCATGTCTNISYSQVVGECLAGEWCNGASACADVTGSACLDNPGCPDGWYCEAGVCSVEKALGQDCEANGECASGQCVDDVCCESDCVGACRRCLANGRCDPIRPGVDDTDFCEAEDLVCGPNGDCKKKNGETCEANSDCASTMCVDDVCCESLCDGECQKCGENGVCGEVDEDPDPETCELPALCLDGECRVDLGTGCEADGECASDVCIAVGAHLGYCCNELCSGRCQSCQRDPIGTCKSVTSDETPSCNDLEWCNANSQCVTKIGATCVTNDDCGEGTVCRGSGTRACALPVADGVVCGSNTECQSGHCVDNFCCESACDEPCESCNRPGRHGMCDPFPKMTSDSLCPPGELCSLGHGCQNPLGGGCAADADCASGFCADGVCCNQECDGVCDKCSASGFCGGLTEGTTARCNTGYTCNQNSQCTLAPGRACLSDLECSSGNCGPNGICCPKDCFGSCRHCATDGVACGNVYFAENGSDCQGFEWCGTNGCVIKTDSDCFQGGDAWCPTDHYCDGAKCAPDIAAGGACGTAENTPASECQSGVCNDNCCSGACPGPCNSCDGDGVCRADARYEPGDCTNGDLCDGLGECKKPKGADCGGPGECASDRCVFSPEAGKNVCCDEACDGLCEACDGGGHCNALTSGYDEQCNAPFECAGRNVCKLQLGETCGSGGLCASGICEDEVCCSTTCDTGTHCTAAGCVANLPLGPSPAPGCSLDSDCASGFCVNGICCANPCASQPDRRCATCVGSYEVCNAIFTPIAGEKVTSKDCNSGRFCNGGALCVVDPDFVGASVPE